MSARLLHLPIPTAASAPVASAAPSSPVSTAALKAVPRHLPLPCAAEPVARWGAPPSVSSLPPATLGEARALRDALAGLLRRERHAAADFLLALSEFDRCRGWAALGYSGLFAFLVGELGLSKGAAYVRSSAAGLLPAFPSVEAALRHGQLCLSTAGEVARVLRPENEAALLPRFFGLSAREARELVAELLPRKDPPVREVVTTLAPEVGRVRTYEPAGHRSAPGPSVFDPPGSGSEARTSADPHSGGERAWSSDAPMGPTLEWAAGTGAGADAAAAALAIGLTGPAGLGGPAGPGGQAERERLEELAGVPRPGRPAGGAASATIEPLTAELRRLHITVTRRFLGKVEAARDGLAHAIPGASMEQVLEAALDLLLERQARRRGLVKRPRLPAEPAAGPCDAEVADDSSAPPAVQVAAAIAAAREPERLASDVADEPVELDRSRLVETLTGAESSRRAGTALATTSGALTAGPTAGGVATAGAIAGGSAYGASSDRTSRYIPAAIRREVWTRDRARCQHPLDSGGTCGATSRLELDHVIPLALGGQSTAANLRVVCAFHNRAAATAVLGDALVDDRRARAKRRR